MESQEFKLSQFEKFLWQAPVYKQNRLLCTKSIKSQVSVFCNLLPTKIQNTLKKIHNKMVKEKNPSSSLQFFSDLMGQGIQFNQSELVDRVNQTLSNVIEQYFQWKLKQKIQLQQEKIQLLSYFEKREKQGEQFLKNKQYYKAIKLFQENCQRRKQVLGIKHPDTLQSMHNLGITLQNLNKHDEAYQVQSEVVQICKSEPKIPQASLLKYAQRLEDIKKLKAQGL